MKIKLSSVVMTLIAVIASLFHETNAQNTSPYWSLAGNSNATATSKLGTTNSIPLRFYTNNSLRMVILANGNIGFGTSTPLYKMHVTIGSGTAVYGNGTTGVSGNGTTYGVYGNSAGNYGVYGNSGYAGVYGNGTSYGVIGSGAYGVYGSGSSYGVYGNSSSGYGVAGVSSSSYGLYGSSSSSWGSVAYGVYGAYGSGTTGYGVEGVSSSNYGVYGTSGYLGVYGSGDSYGVYGSGAYGVYGSGSSYGVVGSGGTYGAYGSGASYGVYGYSANGNGLYAYSGTSNGIWAYANNSGTSGIYAGVFESKVYSYGGYFQSSDKNLKKNIKDMGNAMSIINQLKPKNYEFRDDAEFADLHLPKGTHYGLLAQDLELVLPDLVNDGPTRKFNAAPVKLAANDGKAPTMANEKQVALPEVVKSTVFKAVNYDELIPFMIKGMQEQDLVIQQQQQQINELKNAIAALTGKQIVSGVLTKEDAYLKQNLPNPFNGNTTIQFSVPASAKQAQLLVYAENGSLLKSFSLGRGQSQVTFDKGILASGNYVYTLMVDGQKVDSKNMTLIK
jgi:Chaperone of endosialidase